MSNFLNFFSKFLRPSFRRLDPCCPHLTWHERSPDGKTYRHHSAIRRSSRKKRGNDAITLKSLRKEAEALDCRLVYALVPNEGGLRDIVRKQALRKDRDIVDPVDHSMMLEAQDVGNKQEKTDQLADELARNPNPNCGTEEKGAGKRVGD